MKQHNTPEASTGSVDFLERMASALDGTINATPTGEKRNYLCDLRIELGLYTQKFKHSTHIKEAVCKECLDGNHWHCTSLSCICRVNEHKFDLPAKWAGQATPEGEKCPNCGHSYSEETGACIECAWKFDRQATPVKRDAARQILKKHLGRWNYSEIEDMEDDIIEAMEEYKSNEGEIMELRQWKKEAMAVMPDFQDIGKLLKIPLGQSVHDKIIPGIKKLIGESNEGLAIELLKKVGESGYTKHQVNDRWYDKGDNYIGDTEFVYNIFK